MLIGLTYDLRDSIQGTPAGTDDALEEYDCLETVDAIAGLLEEDGHRVARLGGGREFLKNILQEKPDLVFNISEGLGCYRSREAQVPGVLEMLDIPYSGADPQCLAVCLDKPLTKKLVALSGIPTPVWKTISDTRELARVKWDDFPFPAFVKPAYEGSSKGIRSGSRVPDRSGLDSKVREMLEQYQQPVIVEEFIPGDEVTVGVIGNSPPSVLGIMRILPKKETADFTYSLEVKRDWKRLVSYECPARLEPGILQKLTELSLTAFEVLGCRDITRVDFRVSPSGVPFFLEINPLPGLNPSYSDLPIMAGLAGWSYRDLLLTIFRAALARYPQCRRTQG